MSEEEAMFGTEVKPTTTGSVTINGTESKPKKKINLTRLKLDTLKKQKQILKENLLSLKILRKN